MPPASLPGDLPGPAWMIAQIDAPLPSTLGGFPLSWLVIAGLCAAGLMLALRAMARLKPVDSAGAGAQRGAPDASSPEPLTSEIPSRRSGATSAATSGGASGGGGALARAGRRLRGDGAVTTIEFALVFPIVLTLILMLTQVMLMLGAQTLVHYAAYAGVRVAAVQVPAAWVDPDSTIPLDDASGGAGPVVSGVGEGGRLYQQIADAVAVALAPIGGELSAGPDEQDAADALSEYYGRAELTPPGWIDRVWRKRLAYAKDATTVTLYQAERTDNGAWTATALPEPGSRIGRLKMNAVIGVEVRHQLNLGVPYASAIFADGRRSVEEGDEPYTNVDARAFLPIEAIPRRLPEEPIPARGL
ncbi:MAG: TadE family protein [Planctomycetota bacterium]